MATAEEDNETDWPGEAKIAGRASPVGPVTAAEESEQPDGEVFVADITEIVILDSTPKRPNWSLIRGRLREDCEGSSGTSRRALQPPAWGSSVPAIRRLLPRQGSRYSALTF